MKPIPDICVVGTDTGVGKTVVSLLLIQWLSAEGYSPFYLKPFQTGCADPSDKQSDAAFVYRHTTALQSKDPAPSVIYCLPNPKAPYFAARDAGQRIEMQRVLEKIREKRSRYTPLIVEAAGGLLVPVTEKQTVLDLLPEIDCRPLLVARAGLGTINHTLLSIEALRRRGISPLGVVLVQSEGSLDALALVDENIEAIEKFSSLQFEGALGIGTIPFLSDFSADRDMAGVYQVLQKLLS